MSVFFKKRFRDAEASGKKVALDCLSAFRCSRSVSEYPAIASSFRAAAPHSARELFAIGPKDPISLVWHKPPLKALPLASELEWATVWLKKEANKINVFRITSLEIQDLIIIGEYYLAERKIDEFSARFGWSLWAVELRLALEQIQRGTAAQRDYTYKIQKGVLNSISALLFEVFSDRNDDTFSYDAFFFKCMNSFPRFEELAEWMPKYLKFRALSLVDDPLQTFPGVLARDITSSLIDYYESIIKAVIYIEGDSHFDDLKPVASKLISSLLASGFKDHRLNKIAFALGDNTAFSRVAFEGKIKTHPLDIIYSYEHAPKQSNEGLLEEAFSMLRRVQSIGASANEEITTLLKLGTNLQSLDIGSVLSVGAIQASTLPITKRTLDISIPLYTTSFHIEDLAAFENERSWFFLKKYFITQENKERNLREYLESGAWINHFKEASVVHSWLARQLLDHELYDQFEILIRFLTTSGPFGKRTSDKFMVEYYSKINSLVDACSLSESWLRKDSRYAHEFRSERVFECRKWKDFRNLDPIIVGIVSHFTFEVSGIASIGYICKMACRYYLESGRRSRAVYEYNSCSEIRKEQLIVFFRDVWIEQNLSMCHIFDSTASVREERMQVLQLLLGWEPEYEADYAEAIKELTFDQTLQRGLERIDQSRVFVNESAITRWAEKELQQDYERWRKLSESSAGGRAIDEMLRQYAIDPENNKVLQEFSAGKPTASDFLLIDIVDRLLKRFLLDPTDGLDCYLSVRIRHGSLRGTILGPLEEQGLFMSKTGFSRREFDSRWVDPMGLTFHESEWIIDLLQNFSNSVVGLVDEFINEQIQIQKPEKPTGQFTQNLPALAGKILATSFADNPLSFHHFICSNYFLFWKLVEGGLNSLRSYIYKSLIENLHLAFENIIQQLRLHGPRFLPLVTTLTSASTLTASQCESVAEWFRLPSSAAGENYELPDAIEIALAATKNVHRSFRTEINILCLPSTKIPLTTSALAVLMDGLFVIFENAWKHSGLGVNLSNIDLKATFDVSSKLLTFCICNDLSIQKRDYLLNGKLSELRAKYLGELPFELASSEGGSGFPKLARLTRYVRPEDCVDPLNFFIESSRWVVELTVPLYFREGAYEAYE